MIIKRRTFLVSPFAIAPKRKSWSREEINAAKDYFKEHLYLREVPSMPECAIAIENLQVLGTRSPAQLKAWVNNQIRKKTTSKTKGKS